MKRLKITYKGKEILSDAFNFKAYRVMSDAISDGVELDDVAIQGVIALFDGTPITEEDLISNWKIFDERELSIAHSKIISWYRSIKPPEKVESVGEIPKKPILNLYNRLLMSHLPSELDKQDPQLLLDVMNVKAVSGVSEVPDNMKIYYGL